MRSVFNTFWTANAPRRPFFDVVISHNARVRVCTGPNVVGYWKVFAPGKSVGKLRAVREGTVRVMQEMSE
jgi:hypothetical protein